MIYNNGFFMRQYINIAVRLGGNIADSKTFKTVEPEAIVLNITVWGVMWPSSVSVVPLPWTGGEWTRQDSLCNKTDAVTRCHRR